MEETKDSQIDQTVEEKFNEEVDKLVESGKKKRKMSEAQLATLAAGRSKRWEKKQVQAEELAPIAEEKVEEKEELDIGEKKKSKGAVQIKEEPPSSDDSDDYSSSSGGGNDTEELSDSSSSNDYVTYPSASDESSESDLSSADEVDSPPPTPVLKRQKARDLTAEKNAKSVRKMKEYIKKKSIPYLQRPQQLFL